MKLLPYSLLGVLLCLAGPCFAQTNPTQSLAIGDTFPIHTTLTNVYNYPVSKIQLSKLNKKLILLDFWTTWCAPCRKKIPLLDSLQRVYADELQVILVASKNDNDDTTRIRQYLHSRFFRNNRTVLPSVQQDTLLTNFFPHQGLPHYVWLSGEGKVLALTGAEELTTQNIRQAIETGTISLQQKRELQPVDYAKPLVSTHSNENPLQPVWQSSWFGYLQRLPSIMVGEAMTNGQFHFLALNVPIAQLYREAHPAYKKFSYNRLLVEGMAADNIVPLSDRGQAWLEKHAVSYELIVPADRQDSIGGYLRTDLDRRFQYAVHTETRPVDCWVIRLTPGIDTSSAGAPGKKERPLAGMLVVSSNTIGELVDYLNVTSAVPIIDETPPQLTIAPLLLDNDEPGFEELKAYLQIRGFDLLKEKRMLDVLVFRPRSAQ